jgi:gluconolactonase
MDAIVVPGTHPSAIAGGFKFLEGPAWRPGGHLIWSDILGDTIYELRNGKPVPFIKPSQRAIGNTIDPQGRIVTCHQESRSVTRLEKNGAVTLLADRYEGKRFNSPDDVVVRSDGTIYFTDPSFALKPADRELPYDGVYKISPGGKIQLLLKDYVRPNGLAFSPDEKLLYINDTNRRQIRVCNVDTSGELSNDRVFAYLTGEMAGQANGMKVDVQGNVYCTGPGGIQVFTPTARFIGIIFLQHVVSNFCFGDPDRKTLYITAGQTLFKLRVKIAGS